VKEIILSFFLTLSALVLLAQNLVPNPSFEKFKYCPVTYNQTSLTLVDNWRQASDGTPDYFNSCSDKAGVPENMFGEQNAKSGEAYLGLVTFSASKRNYREYIKAPLNRKLNAGEMVCVELYVSPADHSRYVTDGIGVSLSKKPLKYTLDKILETTPIMESPELHFIDGYEQWTLLSNEFIAKGGEAYITIGNFKPDSKLNVLKRTTKEDISANNWAYVYLDSLVIKPIKEKKECSCVNELLAELVVNPPAQLSKAISLKLESILFDFDSSVLTYKSEDKLNYISKKLLRNKNLFIQINGHTDIIGREGYNQKLSRERAENVQQFIENKGLDINRLEIQFHGSTSPVTENETTEGRAQNRRVAFEILEKSYVVHAKPQKN
jgi:OOP family OmpA-OmpF porin